MKKIINLNEIQKLAEGTYRRGGFSCSESVLSTIITSFELDISKDAIALSSGFSAGMSSGSVCGALAGGIMALGILFGRSEEGESIVKLKNELAKELYQSFFEATEKDSVCCNVLTEGFDLSKGDHKSHCERYVGFVTRKVAEIIINEYNLINHN